MHGCYLDATRAEGKKRLELSSTALPIAVSSQHFVVVENFDHKSQRVGGGVKK